MSEQNKDQNLSAEAIAIKDMIARIQAGESPESIKDDFVKVFGDKPATAISDAEKELMAQGVDSCALSGLCDVHSAALNDTTSGVHLPEVQFFPPHPLAYFQLDGQVIIDTFRDTIRPCVHGELSPELLPQNLRNFQSVVENHFVKKENVLYNYLDKRGIVGPTKVMWATDDEIRAGIANAIAAAVSEEPVNVRAIVGFMHPTFAKIREQLMREQNILIPLLAEQLTDEEMYEIGVEMRDLGYNFDGPREWVPEGFDLAAYRAKNVAPTMDSGMGAFAGLFSELVFPSGRLNQLEIMQMFNNMGVEITLVDANDRVKYFSQPKEMYFIRSKSVLGGDVYDCHPQRSHPFVRTVLENLKSGKSDVESHVAHKKGHRFLVEYRALRDPNGTYLGCMETVTDLTVQEALVSSIENSPTYNPQHGR